ncbi:hypothetical protein Tco_1470746 [Tanacetum coccineum]
MPHDSPLPGGHTPGSDESSMTLHELTVVCTKLSNKVDSLETELKQTKQTYGAAFTKLIKRVKKLEQTVKTNQARRRAKIVVSNNEENEEDPSKQERISTASPEVTTADAELKTASTFVSTASPQRHADNTADDLTLAETLMEIRKSAAKAKEEQARFNAEQEALFVSETTKDEANPSVTDVDWDDVQAQIQAGEDLTQRMQEEERESLSIAERARLLAELINKRKKLQAA